MDLPRGRSGRSAREVAVAAVMEAGATLRRRFGGAERVEYKGRVNVVTETDVLVERELVGGLREEFPETGVLAEESAPVPAGSAYTWVVDPLDGSRNFSCGVPHFAVVLALARGQKVVLGLTYDPLREELFLGERGGGATLNGLPVRASDREALRSCLVGLDLGYRDELAQEAMAVASELQPQVQGVRVMGSGALGLAYACTGRLDLYFHHSLHPWDVAAALVLAEEAGAMATDSAGRPASLRSGSVVVGGPGAHSLFMERALAAE